MIHSRYSTLLRLLLAVIALAGLGYWVADIRDHFEVNLHPEKYARLPFVLNSDTRAVKRVQPEAARAGLPVGATLLSLDGAAYTGRAQFGGMGGGFSVVLGGRRVGDLLSVGFRSATGADGTAKIRLSAEERAGEHRGRMHAWQEFVLLGLSPLLCMLIGYWVVLVKPGEPNAWLLLVLLLYPEAVFSTEGGLASGGWLLFRLAYYNVLQAIGPLALLLFALYFPERSRADVRAGWLKWAIVLPTLLAAVVVDRLKYGQTFLAGNTMQLIAAGGWATQAMNSLALACVLLYLLLLADKLRTASSADAKRRLRVLLAGTGTGVSSLLLIFVLLPSLGFEPSAPGHTWLAYLGATLFLIAPLTLAYVVLVQRAMDVQILLRQGTRYALARATVLGLQLVLVAVLSFTLLVPAIRNHKDGPDQIWRGTVFVVLMLGFRFVFRKRSSEWLDRKFFREAYDSEQVLSQLSHDVRRYTESAPLLQTVTKCVSETLHISQIGMLLRQDDRFMLTESIGAVGMEEITLPASSSTIRFLSRSSQPAQLYRESPDAWYLLADATEQKTLKALGAEVLLPLPGRNRLMGVMALGPKQSEAAYSKSDLHLLQVLATQTGMALEVSELAHSLAKEAAQRERTDREMEIAREVQDRLFPQQMPAIAGCSLAGACRPALGVGGDYYDAFLLEDGRIALAIGDVSGKGISAALLMASLRASLRGVTLENPRDFARVMDKVNRLVYEASADNRYATFFFAALDPETRMLECVNAGHNAPLVLRNSSNGSNEPVHCEPVRLEADGPVVGLLPSASYSRQSLQLEPGDVLVCYTDGISEAMTRSEEEWGEERMCAAASAAGEAPADTVLRTIFAEADRFTGAAPQHDDMTLLVLKVNLIETEKNLSSKQASS